jgi:hypothetical protein
MAASVSDVGTVADWPNLFEQGNMMNHVRRPELSRVTLGVDPETDKARLAKGTSGTVVHVYPQEAAYEVEFSEPIHAIAIAPAAFLQTQTEAADARWARIKAAAGRQGYILDPIGAATLFLQGEVKARGNFRKRQEQRRQSARDLAI